MQSVMMWYNFEVIIVVQMGCGTSGNTIQSVSPPKEISKVIETVTFAEIPVTKQSGTAGTVQVEQVEVGVGQAPAKAEGVEAAIQVAQKEKREQERAVTAATAATEQMRHEAMKHVPEGKGFLFGQSENERKIVLLDCQKMQFSILSTKGQAPTTPNKYQPKDVIFEQSQEMLASNLFNKNSHPPYNFMFITFISEDTIFLCGGVNFAFEYFSQEAFIFRLSSIEGETLQPRRKKGNSLVGNKFEKMPCMKSKRYSHMGAFFKTGRLGYIYIFGGRDEEDQLLASCEQFSIEEKKWRDMPPMRAPRSTGFSLIFKSKIYVFGGYSAEKKRSKTIEVFDPAKNYWETLNVKLHRGIQAGLLFSIKPNEVLLMGGNMETGPLRSVIRLNLAEQTYLWDSSMKNERLLQKGVKFNDNIFVFGGDFQDDFEKYSCKDRKWRDIQFSYSEFIAVDDINSYQMATETLEVVYDETLLSKVDTNVGDFERYHIFGDDNFPCILQLNLTKFVLKKRPVPMALRLRCGMGVAKVVEGKYFLCGGIDSLGEKPSRAAYLYYSGTNKALEVAKMSCKKHDFAICLLGKHVYLFGGRGEGQEILNQCEMFSLEEEKWVKLPNLPTERAGAKALPVGNKIFLFGGCDTLQNVSTIDIFDTQSNTFWNSKQSLSMSAEIKAVLLDPLGGEAVYIFSHNEVLGKHFCHHLKLTIPQTNEEQPQQEKIEDDFQAVRQVEEKQITIKVPQFAHAFFHNGKYHIITAKGLLTWVPSLQDQKGFQSQIVINQVQMLQFPVEKFSAI